MYRAEHIDNIEKFTLMGNAEKVYLLLDRDRTSKFAAYIESLIRKSRSILCKVNY